LSHVKLCSLEDTHLSEFLFELGISKNRQKKELPNKELAKEINEREEIELSLNLLNYLQINPNYDGPEIEIIHECDKFIALNKPPKIHCHPLSYNESDNCLSFLVSKGYKLEHREAYDRTLLYRLDYETSGVLVLAKKEEDYHRIRENFKDYASNKIYRARVQGKVPMGIHELMIKPYGEKGAKMVQADDGQLAQLEVIDSKDGEVTIKLETGLRHQIRVQLAHLGFPILGDTLYGGYKSERMHLYAVEYEIDGVKFSVGSL
jgi:23S rRNA pseudouridine1911/1915/1917 synthase